MSATRPATEFSMGIMASFALPVFTAASASSKVAQGNASMSGIGVAGGQMRVGAGLALEGDFIQARSGHGLVLGRRARSSAGFKKFPRPRKIGRSIDTERDSVNEADMDAHAVLQRAQLLELLAGLERRRRQADEALQRRAPISVDADMVVERTVAVRRGGAREIERSENAAARQRRADHLHHVRVGALLLADDLRGDGADIRLALVQRGNAGAHEIRIERRQVALQIDDGVDAPVRIELLDRLIDAVRAAGMVGARHHRLAAGLGHRIGARSSEHRWRPARGREPASIARRQTWTIMGSPAIIGHGLVGQSRGGQSRRNDDQRIRHIFPLVSPYPDDSL